MGESYYLIREARKEDAKSIVPLAALLDRLSLPVEEEALADELVRSEASFGGSIRALGEERYILVMEEKPAGKIIGTSSLIAQHGTKAVPHVSLIVFAEERVSAVLRKTMVHACLQLKVDRDGPTAISSLVLLPEYRSNPLKLGKQLSLARFAFLKMHRERFRDRLLAKLMPVNAGGAAPVFWEAFGKRFTGLDYAEAARLSLVDDEFVLSLFPKDRVYASLLPPEAQQAIGATSSLVEQKILEKIGFRYSHEVSPFDGAPYYTAVTDEVTVVRLTDRYGCQEAPIEAETSYLVAVHEKRKFRAIACPGKVQADRIVVPPGTIEKLELGRVESVWALPLTG